MNNVKILHARNKADHKKRLSSYGVFKNERERRNIWNQVIIQDPKVETVQEKNFKLSQKKENGDKWPLETPVWGKMYKREWKQI